MHHSIYSNHGSFQQDTKKDDSHWRISSFPSRVYGGFFGNWHLLLTQPLPILICLFQKHAKYHAGYLDSSHLQPDQLCNQTQLSQIRNYPGGLSKKIVWNLERTKDKDQSYTIISIHRFHCSQQPYFPHPQHHPVHHHQKYMVTCNSSSLDNPQNCYKKYTLMHRNYFKLMGSKTIVWLQNKHIKTERKLLSIDLQRRKVSSLWRIRNYSKVVPSVVGGLVGCMTILTSEKDKVGLDDRGWGYAV